MTMNAARACKRGVWICALSVLAGCGGGGGGDEGVTSSLSLAPPPAAEAFASGRLHGSVNMAVDTLDRLPPPEGTAVEVRSVQANGTLGGVVATGSTAANGQFDIALPTGRSSGDGDLLVLANLGSHTLRAQAHPGAMRVDLGSDALHRILTQSLGKLPRFAADQSAGVRSLHRSAALLADAQSAPPPGLSADAAADRLAGILARDAALTGALGTHAASGRLPAVLGDVGSFLGIRSDSLWIRVDGADLAEMEQVASMRVSAPGELAFELQTSEIASNGSVTLQHGAARRLATDALYGWLPTYGRMTSEEGALATALGEMRIMSLPLQPGAERVAAKQVGATGLDFTGDGKEDPLAYGRTVQIVGVETVTVETVQYRAVKVLTTEELVFPGAAGAVRRLVGTTTQWLVPSLGPVRVTTEARLDGQPASPQQSLSLTRALVGGVAWPGQVGATQLPLSVGSSTCHAFSPGLRRIVQIASGYDFASSSFRTRLRMFDIDTGVEPVPEVSFPGTVSNCRFEARVADSADGDSFYLVLNMSVPSGTGAMTLDDAERYSSVVRQIRYADLSARSEVRVPIVAHPNVAGSYVAKEVAFFTPHPSEVGSFFIGAWSLDSSLLLRGWVHAYRSGAWGAPATLTDLYAVSIDWDANTIYYQNGTGNLRAMDLIGSQFDSSTDRALFSLQCVHTRLVGGTLECGVPPRRYSATDGSFLGQLTYEVGQECRYLAPYLYCWRGFGWDRLQRRDPVTFAVLDEVVVGSDLRAWTGGGMLGDLDHQGSSQFVVLSGSEFIYGYARISVGAWK